MRNHLIKQIKVFCLIVTLTFPAMARASSTPQRPSGERRRPPQAAFDACKDKSEGTSVEISTPGGTIKATCKSFEGQLVAVPEGARPGPPPSGASRGSKIAEKPQTYG